VFEKKKKKRRGWVEAYLNFPKCWKEHQLVAVVVAAVENQIRTKMLDSKFPHSR